MEHIKFILTWIVASIFVFLILDKCWPESTPQESPPIQTIRKSIDTLYLTPNPIDTVELIKIAYRNRIDTIIQRINDSTTWLDVCRGAGISENELECKRILVRGYIAGQRDSGLLQLYRRQRNKDSLMITMYAQLDTAQTKRISNLVSKNMELTESAAKRKKRAKLGHIVAGLGIVALIILK